MPAAGAAPAPARVASACPTARAAASTMTMPSSTSPAMAAPSPDGRYLVSASTDQTLRLWSLASRELIVTLFHGNDGEWVMWTPQGYFTGSDRAEQIVGWQQGYGP